MASSTPATVISTLILAMVSSGFPSKAAADSLPECPYPCLPPPTSAANCPPPPSPPPPPPSQPDLPCPPPPPQPYPPGYSPPPPSWPGNVPYYPPPTFNYPAPPPPNKIVPYFPYYYRSSANSWPSLKCCFGLPMALLHLLLVGLFLS